MDATVSMHIKVLTEGYAGTSRFSRMERLSGVVQEYRRRHPGMSLSQALKEMYEKHLGDDGKDWKKNGF